MEVEGTMLLSDMLVFNTTMKTLNLSCLKSNDYNSIRNNNSRASGFSQGTRLERKEQRNFVKD